MYITDSEAIQTAKRQQLMKQLHIHIQQDNRAHNLLKLALLLTFLMYLAFNAHIYLGDSLTWHAYFTTWSGTVGFMFMLSIVVLMAAFLAWVKHHAYLHFGLYGSITLIVFTVIGFALFAEFFSSSASQDTKSNIALERNSAYQQTIAPPATVSVNNGLADKIATASKKLAQCETKLAAGKEKHCNGDKAQLDGLMQAQAASATAAIEMHKATTEINYNRQDKLKADSYNPVIVFTAQAMAGNGGNYQDYIKTAVVLIMLFVAISFEILHHFLSISKERSMKAIESIEMELAKMNGAKPLTVDNEAPNPVAPVAPAEVKNPIGFGLPQSQTAEQQTSQPVFQYQRAQKKQTRFMGFVDTDGKNNMDSTDDFYPVYTSIRDRILKGDLNPDWHSVLNEVGFLSKAPFLERRDMADKILTSMLREGVIEPVKNMTWPGNKCQLSPRNAELVKLRKNEENNEMTMRTGSGHPVHRAETQGYASPAANPVLGTEEEQLPLPTISMQSPAPHPAQPAADTLRTGSANPVHRVAAGSMYRDWLADVHAGNCKPTATETRRWVQKRVAGKGSQSARQSSTMTDISLITETLFDRACKDQSSRITLNPNYSNGKAKYFYGV